MRSVPLLLAFVSCAAAEPPAFYRNVSRISWVVRDADAAAAAWRKFGLAGIERRGEVELPVQFRGQPGAAKLIWLDGWLGNVAVDFIQPLGGHDAYAEFLEKHGEGIFGLLHEVPSTEAFNAEVGRMRGLGAGVLQRGKYIEGGTTVDFLYFDTAAQGGYALGLIHFEGEPPSGLGASKISQYAFVIRDIAPVSAYWQKLGFPAMEVTHPKLRDLAYRGKPAGFEQDLGWQRHATLPYEWCVPPRGAGTVYAEYLEKHGQGLHHLGFQVDDLDKAVARAGVPVSQSGAWGEKGQKGSGRFAYLDTEPVGGVTVELLWNFR